MIVFLGDRVPIELRVFLTAAVIIDDIVAILVIALFYSDEIATVYLILGAAVVVLLRVLNRIAIFIASVIAAVLGTIILYPRRDEESEPEVEEETDVVCSAI